MQENVWASFFDAHGGETEGSWVANAATYGADKLLVLLKPIAVELDDEPEPSPAPGAAGPSGARGADGGGTAPDMQDTSSARVGSREWAALHWH